VSTVEAVAAGVSATSVEAAVIVASYKAVVIEASLWE
jgi:hypothetical protein